MNPADDQPVLDAVAAAYDDVGPVPSELTDVARAAFGWRNIDHQLATQVFDSSVDELVGVRGGQSGRRTFEFRALDTTVHINLSESTMVVMLEPPAAIDCRVVSADGVSTVRTDEFGELVVDAPALPVRFECDLPNGSITTPAIIG